MERALERDHSLPAGVQTRELDCVLDRLGPGVEERAPARAFDRGERAKPFRQLDVGLVSDHGEVGVEKSLSLRVHGLDHPRVAVSDVQDADSAYEIEERVAVDVGDRRSARMRRDDRAVDDQRRRHGVALPLEDLACPGPRNLGAELDSSGRSHAAA